jgi:hypothetical protein
MGFSDASARPAAFLPVAPCFAGRATQSLWHVAIGSSAGIAVVTTVGDGAFNHEEKNSN